MDSSKVDLQRSYDIFINAEQPMVFYRGLISYLDFALTTPPYRKEFERRIKEYDELLRMTMTRSCKN